jgi:hypothetical protein
MLFGLAPEASRKRYNAQISTDPACVLLPGTPVSDRISMFRDHVF